MSQDAARLGFSLWSHQRHPPLDEAHTSELVHCRAVHVKQRARTCLSALQVGKLRTFSTSGGHSRSLDTSNFPKRWKTKVVHFVLPSVAIILMGIAAAWPSVNGQQALVLHSRQSDHARHESADSEGIEGLIADSDTLDIEVDRVGSGSEFSAPASKEKPHAPSLVHHKLVDVSLVELQTETPPWKIAKVLVPLSPEVARWWTDAEEPELAAHPDGSLTEAPQVHLEITADIPLEVDGMRVMGVHAVVDVPDNVMLDACRLGWVRVTVDSSPLLELGTIRALILDCPVQPSKGSTLGALSIALNGRPLTRLLLLPWLLLLFPFLLGSSIGPLALLGGACLTLASIACISFFVAVVIVAVQRRCVLSARRWRRLFRLRAMVRRPFRIQEAFGDSGPCCICLGESNQREKLIALLPCKHALHADCYSSWVRADAYPSLDLICPLCRRRADAVGRLAV
mmetsp:Transcript_83076/g.164789  ORF Transcript_83076/g.164789 Transcript_83076/m.164789 type:complete len:455 (-) Transcript_83076:180-1544(-)